jgi:hypothetical protein
MNIIATLENWWSQRKQSKARKSASQWKRDALSCMRELRKSTTLLEHSRDRFERECELIRSTLESRISRHEELVMEAESRVRNAQDVIDRYDHTEELLENELEVLRDIVVPQLVLANETAREQIKADTSLQVQRQVYYTGGEKTTKE